MSLDASFSLHHIFKISFFLFACAGSLLLHRLFPVAVHWILIVMASLVVAPGLKSAGSVLLAHGLSCSLACGIFLGQGSNPCLLHWQADSYPLCHQGSP